MNNVLIVCIGNICRSPMAQVLLNSKSPELKVASAGISALVGSPADAIAVDLLRARGLDLSSHFGSQVNFEKCQAADLILVMESGHKKHLEAVYPSTRGKVFLLAGPSTDIPDPYKRGVTAFEDSLRLIDAGVEMWIELINKINAKERQST